MSTDPPETYRMRGRTHYRKALREWRGDPHGRPWLYFRCCGWIPA